MDDDIVIRLRRITAKPLGLVLDPPPHPLCKEAADEIENLRVRAAMWQAAAESFETGRSDIGALLIDVVRKEFSSKK